jgi:hypothetical protein
VLLAIATWESKALRDAMEGDQASDVQAIFASQAEFMEVINKVAIVTGSSSGAGAELSVEYHHMA